MKSLRHGAAAAALFALVWLAGCSSGLNKAPVEERSAVAPTPPLAAPSAVAPEPVRPPAPDPDAGKAGLYIVKPGDTLIRIGLETGQNWRDIARWNGIDNPNLIEVGQALRVSPPAPEAGAAVSRPVAGAGRVESRPLDGRAAASAPPLVPSPSAPAPNAAPAPAPAPAAPREADDDVPWIWPAAGPVATPFDDARSKGLAITGKAGDPVFAAADGRVVYAGSGLRGYGNLVIVKHNTTYLTAYAHNQTLLVKEDQAVRRGQKIAEMGSSDAERVQLHFEIRRQGKPIDPMRLLPPR